MFKSNGTDELWNAVPEPAVVIPRGRLPPVSRTPWCRKRKLPRNDSIVHGWCLPWRLTPVMWLIKWLHKQEPMWFQQIFSAQALLWYPGPWGRMMPDRRLLTRAELLPFASLTDAEPHAVLWYSFSKCSTWNCSKRIVNHTEDLETSVFMSSLDLCLFLLLRLMSSGPSPPYEQQMWCIGKMLIAFMVNTHMGSIIKQQRQSCMLMSAWKQTELRSSPASEEQEFHSAHTEGCGDRSEIDETRREVQEDRCYNSGLKMCCFYVKKKLNESF